MPWRKKDKVRQSPVRLLAWAALFGFLIGVVGIGQIVDDQLRIGRNKLHSHPASGDIVFVRIDDSSLAQVGRWPWKRSVHGQLVDKLTAAGANRILFDVTFDAESDVAEDQALASAVRRSGKVFLPVRGLWDAIGKKGELTGPTPLLMVGTGLHFIGVEYNYQNAVWHLPTNVPFKGQNIPSLASRLARVPSAETGADFPIDYSIDPKSVPTLAAVDVLNGRLPQGALRGKDVVIGADASSLGDRFFIPGMGQMAGAYIQILGGETLKSGTPISVGWLGCFAACFLICATAVLTRSRKQQIIILGSATVAVIFVPAALEARLIFVDIAPSLFLLATIWGTLTWRHFKSDGLKNHVSDLPNLNAIRSSAVSREQALVVARFLNYADVVSTLPASSERNLVEQIVSRLTVGSGNKIIYHGDGGIFAWFEPAQLSFGDHIDALYSMFRNPVRVGDVQIDLQVCFGIELGSDRSVPNRLASALAAAEDASHHGHRWKVHDPENMQDAKWRLSILSKLDQAIDNGEVWVAYQPKLDLRTRHIIGAEALARWNHPEKGPIAATEFIPAAEQNNRIGKLTDFVLDQAVAAAARVNGAGRPFHMAVNLSARLLDDKDLKSRLSAILLKHLLDPELLTLELTETSAIGSRDSLKVLSELRDIGVNISIDDYGTGMSTLDYLKKIPASEIKIDQSFIRGITESRSDKVMVQSTIALAHSLNRTVVAEGVETQEVLDALVQMKCDVAQGFIIGRPMSFDSLRRRLIIDQRRSVA
ncbi:EAL domain-containing protein [Sphingomonas piscis]|uniref:EAL domain-containing protein n=1 Tax=Sphingomonas piscis TaxID=2714943 RepID=A0A6G7YSA4_9SPHN|nr:EAL domain-containing protein [Sphingomonas piscis]QIK79614.1 EAL domain-containing protein [Sphingomonas piscis]